MHRACQGRVSGQSRACTMGGTMAGRWRAGLKEKCSSNKAGCSIRADLSACNKRYGKFQLPLMFRVGGDLLAQGFLGISTKFRALTTLHRALQASRGRCGRRGDKSEGLQNRSRDFKEIWKLVHLEGAVVYQPVIGYLVKLRK